MTKDEALKLALEALEDVDGIDTETECVTIDVGEAITAIREVFAQQPYPDNFIDALKYDVARRDSETAQKDYWQEEARRYAQNADFWRGKYEAATVQQQEPTVEDNSQNWRGMDGTTAYWLIQRHADGWADIGKMMGEWLSANQAHPEQEPDAPDIVVVDDSNSQTNTMSWAINLPLPIGTPLYTSPPVKPWVNPSIKEYEDIMLANITPRTNDERDGIMGALNDMVVLLQEKNG